MATASESPDIVMIRTHPPDTWAAYRRPLSLFMVNANIAIYAGMFWLTMPVLPFLTSSLGVDPTGFGYLQTTFAFIQLLGGPVMGRLIDLRGARWAIIVAQAASGVSYILLGMATTVPMLFLSRMPSLLQHCMQASQAAVADLSDRHTRAKLIGRLTLSYGVGMVLGPLIGGLLSEVYGPSFVATVGGVLCLLSIVPTLLFMEDTRKYRVAKSTAHEHSHPTSTSHTSTHTHTHT
eukprot:Opistho-2@37428